MSGVTLAVGPRSEPSQISSPSSKAGEKQKQQVAPGGMMGSLRVIELQLVAFILVFSASGLVPLLDVIFPAFVTAYLVALSRFAFPAKNVNSDPQAILRTSRFFRLYVVVGTIIGLFLPLAYVLGGFAKGDDHSVRSATPHLFLLSFQILTENIISGLSLFSPPVRALVPLLYTVRRLFVIIDWIGDVWINKTLPVNAPFKEVAWYWFGKVLAIANLVYFSVNLFGFLIPLFLPKAFERYFQDRDETCAKTVEDERSASLSTGKKLQASEKKAD